MLRCGASRLAHNLLVAGVAAAVVAAVAYALDADKSPAVAGQTRHPARWRRRQTALTLALSQGERGLPITLTLALSKRERGLIARRW